MNFEPLIELTRNGVQECVHMGALAVTDTEGRVLAQVGNPHWLCFTRSTLKAMQALPLIQSGGVAHFGFTPTELAMMCASHNGEDMHVEQVTSILRNWGSSRRHLRCGCLVPPERLAVRLGGIGRGLGRDACRQTGAGEIEKGQEKPFHGTLRCRRARCWDARRAPGPPPCAKVSSA